MKKNETYDIFVCISFSLAVICALSVFFENFILYRIMQSFSAYRSVLFGFGLLPQLFFWRHLQSR